MVFSNGLWEGKLLSTMTLDDALEVVGLETLEGLDLATLKKVAKKAKRKWHPDLIAHTKPDEAMVKKYQTMFNRVSDAVDMLTRVITGDASNGSSSDEERWAQMLFDIEGKLAKLKSKWAEVRKSKENVEKIEKVLFHGLPIGEWLDLESERSREMSLAMAIFSAIFIFAIAHDFLNFALSKIGLSMIVVNYIDNGLVILMLIDVLILVVSSLPLSDAWLPGKGGIRSFIWATHISLMTNRIMFVIAIFVVTMVVSEYSNDVVKWGVVGAALAAGFVGILAGTILTWFMPPILLYGSGIIGFLLKLFITGPIRIILSIWKDKMMGVVKVKYKKYAHISENDIKDILKIKKAENLSETQVIYVNHLIESYPEIFEAVEA